MSLLLAFKVVGQAVFDLPLGDPNRGYDNQLRTFVGKALTLVSVQNPFSQSDWPVPQPLARIDESWSYTYNPNLIGQDKLPTGARSYDLPPVGSEPNPRRSWEYKYLSTLVGQDKLPIRQQYWPNPYPVQWYQSWELGKLSVEELEVPVGTQYFPQPPPLYWYRSWEFTYPPTLVGQDKLPFFNRDWPNPPPVYWYRDWSVSINNSSLVPIGKQFYDLPPVGQEPNPRRSWEYKYLSTLVGQDVLPNRQDDWPNPQPVQWYNWWYQPGLIEEELLVPSGARFFDLPPIGYEPNPRRSWEWWYNLNLIGQDKLPFKGPYDLPPVDYVTEPNPRRSWEWRQVGYLNQDRLPVRQQDWPVPPPVIWYREAYIGFLSSRLTPFNQLDWPNPPPVQWYRSLEEWYNYNLVGKDQLPNRQSDWPVPPPIIWYQDASAGFRSDRAPVVFKPFFQSDWPNPQPVQWYRDLEEWYNLNLIGKDQLPIRQQDWPNPYPVYWYKSWEFPSLEELELLVPFKQTDWPNPPPVQWFRSIEESYNLSLIGKDQLPFRQQDWPLPRDLQRLVDYFVANTKVPVVVLPFNTSDWPLSKIPQAIDQFYAQNLALIPGAPVIIVTDLHFKPLLITMGRMGNLGGLS